MKKPDNVHEFDGYDFPYDPSRTKILSKEEEDKLLKEIAERVKMHRAQQEAEDVMEQKKTANSVSISVAAPNISFMENGR